MDENFKCWMTLCLLPRTWSLRSISLVMASSITLLLAVILCIGQDVFHPILAFFIGEYKYFMKFWWQIDSFRIPYFCKRVCDSNFTRQDLIKGVQELYNSTLDDPSAFIESLADALYDQYEYQRLVKKVSSGKQFIVVWHSFSLFLCHQCIYYFF